MPEDLVIDGKSIAPLILGKENDSKRDWIMALSFGGPSSTRRVSGPAKILADGSSATSATRSGSTLTRQIDRLHDLSQDPKEETNLIDSKEKHQQALAKFTQILSTLPDKDARPSYEPRAANPWDRKK